MPRPSEIARMSQSNCCADGDAADGFEGLLSRVASLHRRELGDLQEENSRLRVQLRQATGDLSKARSPSTSGGRSEQKAQPSARGAFDDLPGRCSEAFPMTERPGADEPLRGSSQRAGHVESATEAAPESKWRSSVATSGLEVKPWLSGAACRGVPASVDTVSDARPPSSIAKTSMGVSSAHTGPPAPGPKQRTTFHQVLTTRKASLLGQQAVQQEEECKTPVARRCEKESRRSLDPSAPCLTRWIEAPAFDLVCACVIILNSILIGCSIQWLTSHDEEHISMKVASYICSVFFAAELALRLCAQGCEFFLSPENRNWNWFDLLLVVLSVLDFVLTDLVGMKGQQATLGSVVKTIKMLRIVRLFRVFRFFQELSLLALMVIDSMRSLVWALVMLTIITYVFAICLTSRASEYLKLADDRSEKVDQYFGSIGRTTHSLIQTMLAGVSWGEFSDVLYAVDWFSHALFFFYVFFTMLAVLNIITGVFVDNAVESARNQRDVMMQKEMEIKETYIREMRELFAQMDEDESGTITHQEIKEYLDDPRVLLYFQVLGLDARDSEKLFSLIDERGNEEVSVQEFIDGCLRLKGQARSIDVYSIMRTCSRLEVRLLTIERLLNGGGDEDWDDMLPRWRPPKDAPRDVG